MNKFDKYKKLNVIKPILFIVIGTYFSISHLGFWQSVLWIGLGFCIGMIIKQLKENTRV